MNIEAPTKKYENCWTNVTRKYFPFCGRRLSEIAKQVLDGGLTLEGKETALKALAVAWLDLVNSSENRYGQHETDRLETTE